jgi:ABC-type branched-subunit amino acid transport system substrate-binding protein
MEKALYSALAIIIIVSGALFIKNNTEPKTPSEIKIGIIAPLSGQFSFVGENMVAGARLYEREWNIAHPDKKLTLVVENDEFDSKKGISAYKKLTELDRADAIYNLTTPTIDALYSTVANRDVPIVQLGVQSIPASSDSIFQITPDQAPMFEGFGTFVKGKSPKKPVLLVSGKVVAYEIFADAFKKGYGDIEAIKVTDDAAGAKTLALKLSNENYSDYIIIASPSEGATIAKELITLSKNIPHFFLDSSFLTGFPEYQKIMGETISKLEASPVLSFKDIPKDFKQRYKASTGKDVGIASDLGYEGVKALVETMPAPGTKESWITNMQNAKLPGVTGEISFDKLGLRSPAFDIKTYTNGKVQ